MSYKVGDKVICLPGFNRDGNWKSDKSGGGGWEEGRVYTIKSIDHNNGYNEVLWPKCDGSGVFTQAVTLYIEEPNYEIY
jgi:hypothetical protein